MRVGFVLLPPIGIIALLACDPPNPENEAPSVRILSPDSETDRRDGSPVFTVAGNAPIVFDLRLRDRDGDGQNCGDTPDDPCLSVQLFLDEDGERTLLDEAVELRTEPVVILTNPNDPGSDERDDYRVDVQLTAQAGLPEGEHTLVLVASDGYELDPELATRESELAFIATAGITAPTVELSPASPLTTDALVANENEAAADPNGGVPYVEWRWRRVSPAPEVLVPAGGAGTGDFPVVLDALETASGDEWEFCATAYESEDGEAPPDLEGTPSATTCVSTTVGNSLPSAPFLPQVDPSRPTLTDALHCRFELDGEDPDGDPVDYTYAWLRDGVIEPGITSEWLPPGTAASGEEWSCEITSVDSVTAEPGGSETSAPVTMDADVVSVLQRRDFALDGAADVGLAPIESGTTGPLECVVVGRPELATLNGQLNLYRADAIGSGPTSRVEGPALAGLGTHISAGDIDGDGFSDLVATGTGQAWVLFSETLPASINPYTADSATVDIQGIVSATPGFGAEVHVGPFAGGAAADVAVQMRRGGTPNQVHIFSTSSFDATAADLSDADVLQVISGPGTDDAFGDVLTSGDIFSNPSEELVVADPGAADAVYIFEGGASIVDATSFLDASIIITDSGSMTGTAVTMVDVDGNGVSDLVVGAPDFSSGDGAVAIFFDGGLAALHADPTNATDRLSLSQADVLITGTGGAFGSHLAVWPDLTGQGSDRLLVAAPDASDGSNEGVVYVYLTDALTTSTTSAMRYVGTESLEVRHDMRDLDGDGYADLVFTGAEDSSGAGVTYVLLSD